jgi:hypothetical protein
LNVPESIDRADLLVLVGMQRQDETAVGALDLIDAGTARHSEDQVRVFGLRHVPPTVALTYSLELTSILRGIAFSIFGRVTVSTPSFTCAEILAVSTICPILN